MVKIVKNLKEKKRKNVGKIKRKIFEKIDWYNEIKNNINWIKAFLGSSMINKIKNNNNWKILGNWWWIIKSNEKY